MNKCEQYCRTIKRMAVISGGGSILPSTYQAVEYLQSSGTQYIITSVLIEPTTETRCDGMFISGNNVNSATLIGGRNSDANSGRYIVFGQILQSGKLRFVYNNEVTTSLDAYTRRTIVFNDSQHKAYSDGTQVANYSGYTLSTTTKQHVTLFGMQGYSGSNVDYKATGRLYSVSFYNNSTGDKIGDYIPCYRKSDDKPGMYDIVTNTFFTNAGSGEFTLGPSTDVPSEYQKVEYLQSTGVQWIDSGVSASNTLQVTLEFSLLNNFDFSGKNHLFGEFYAWFGAYAVNAPSANQIRVPIDNGNDSLNYTTPTALTSGIHSVVYREGYVSVDGTYLGTTSGLYTKTLPVRIVGRYGTDNQGNYSSSLSSSPAGIRIYSAQFGTSSNATAYRDLYPCYRKSDNVTGMYDLVTSTFIPYSGTENFILGNNV